MVHAQRAEFELLAGAVGGAQWGTHYLAHGSLPRSDSRGAGELVRTMGVQAGKERVKC